MYFLGGSRVFMDLKALLCSGDDESPQHRSVLRAINTLNSPKNYTCLLGGYHPSIRCVGAEQKVSCGALGGHFCRRRLWLAMVVMVDVGRWRRTSDQPTVGIVKIVYGSISFYSYVHPIQSWHLTRQQNKEELDLCTLLFSWFLCPVLYGNFFVQYFWRYHSLILIGCPRKLNLLTVCLLICRFFFGGKNQQIWNLLTCWHLRRFDFFSAGGRPGTNILCRLSPRGSEPSLLPEHKKPHVNIQLAWQLTTSQKSRTLHFGVCRLLKIYLLK